MVTQVLVESGVEVGSVVPMFTLPSAAGGVLDLRERLGRGPLVVVFFRGHWCPYCRRYLAKLQKHLHRYTALGAEVVGVSPEGPEVSRRLAGELGLGFPVVSDEGGRVIDAYGVRNTFSSVRTLLPHPAVFITDATGKLLFKSVDRNYKKRTTMRTLVGVLEAHVGRTAPVAEE